MKYFNKHTGFLAETFAAEELKKKGYQILERNFSNKWGEIDIIAQKSGTIIFVEVKAKTGLDFGSPEEMISPRKLQRVRTMAAIYLQGRTLSSLSCRIDVIAVVLNPDNTVQRLTHYENVY